MIEWKFPRGITVHRPSSRDAWLALRQTDVTASDAGALLGVHDYTTAYELWARKRGLIPPAESNEVMLRGELLEDDALELLHRQKPTWRIGANVIGKQGFYLEDPVNRLGGTPDAFCFDEDNVPGLIEIKTTDHGGFERRWGGREDPQPPLWIAVQATLNAYLAGAQRAHIACLAVGRTLDLHVITVPVNIGVIKRLQIAATAFWIAVAQNLPPDPDYERDGEVLKALLNKEEGTTIDLSGDAAFLEALQAKRDLDAEISAMKSQLGRHEALLRHRIGDNAVAVVDGRIVATNKLVRRKAYSVGAAEFRKLVVKPLENGTDEPEPVSPPAQEPALAGDG